MVPLTLRSTVRRQASESIWVIGPMVCEPPAQCTTPCSRPVPGGRGLDHPANLVLVGDVGRLEPDRAAGIGGDFLGGGRGRSPLRPTISTSAPERTDPGHTHLADSAAPVTRWVRSLRVMSRWRPSSRSFPAGLERRVLCARLHISIGCNARSRAGDIANVAASADDGGSPSKQSIVKAALTPTRAVCSPPAVFAVAAVAVPLMISLAAPAPSAG